jgi:hypothetical protein
MRYPRQAAELVAMLEADQAERKHVGRLYFNVSKGDDLPEAIEAERHSLLRGRRAMDIMDECGEPSFDNYGQEGVQAIAVLAQHAPAWITAKVLEQMQSIFERDRRETDYKAIPSMTDRLLLLDQEPQQFGTIWLFDEHKQPFLPTVEDFEQVNARRKLYDIGRLRWPRSMAIPESEQPWLKRPLSELNMRWPTDQELAGLG